MEQLSRCSTFGSLSCIWNWTHHNPCLYYCLSGYFSIKIRFFVVFEVNNTLFQSSYYGQAYVTSGGIGQRWIRYVVSASNTYYFNVRTMIYGY